jgi:hypothetical protein
MNERLLEENIKRNAILDSPYDPIIGVGSPLERQKVIFSDVETIMLLPVDMLNTDWVNCMAGYHSLSDYSKKFDVSVDDALSHLIKERFKYDLEFWAATTITITDKNTFDDIPFILRGAQRILLAVLEEMRLAGVPIRIVLYKARQWGGSTLVQIYMMWIQQLHRRNWHLAVCAHNDDAARNIRGMYTKAAKLYPKEFGKITLRPFEGSSKNRVCIETGGIIGVGSFNNPDQFRSYSYAMAHLSEVSSWKDTPNRTAKQLITSIKETVPDVPYSFIAEESTAKGLNYFYDSWKRAIKGNTRYQAIFIPWWRIDRDRLPIDGDINEFIKGMGEYDWTLWNYGATLEGINWYNKHKADRYEEADKENRMFSEWEMMQENPSTPEEGFQSAGEKRFNPLYINAMEQDCMPPAFIGDVKADGTTGKKAFLNIEFIPNSKGKLSIWTMPDTSIKVLHRYAGFADIGGTWRGADYSVLKVVDRYWMLEDGDPEVVAVLYGHFDKDIFGWMCAQVCTMYDNALLAYETNFYDKDRRYDDHFLTVVEKVSEYYDNLYIRNKPEKVGSDYVPIYGFHTNKTTKPAMIDALYAASRERYNKDQGKKSGFCLIERDIRAIKEMNWFERKEDGRLGAVEGQKDDHVDATAGVFYIATEKMPMPQLIDTNKPIRKRIMKSEASF